MIASEVKRTLVKSPPELWAELSDPAALSRQLGELGEIQITRVEHERRVDWESDGIRGTVLIKPSGWGTKVTLTVTRELPASECAAPTEPPLEPEAELQPPAPPMAEAEALASSEPTAEAQVEGEPTMSPEPEVEPAPQLEAERAIEPAAEPEPDPSPERESRRGFFARLFARRRRTAPVAEDSLDAPAEAEGSNAGFLAEAPESPPSAIETLQARFQPEPPGEPDTVIESPAASQPEPFVEAHEGAEERADLAAELREAEEVAAEEVTAVLTAVLDRLGAAHHRPFSRS